MTTEHVSASALYRLMTFLSPAFPIGAFTYSHGLEQAIDDGDVSDVDSLYVWLDDVLRYGAGRSDGILLKETMLCCARGDNSGLVELVDLGLALQPSQERYLESSAQGTAFMEAIRQAWTPEDQTPATQLVASLLIGDTSDRIKHWPYPVAVGATAAAWAIPVDAALTGLLHAFASNVISAAIRAVPLGQNNGQRVLAKLEPTIAHVRDLALTQSLDDLGTNCFLADIASMNHETKYSRLFRS
ncbi:MAG: urease accessory protein UreF [Rhodobacteraceae bacterium]|nr:urease accessory protein UreF [Paracoccaceae bacterium]